MSKLKSLVMVALCAVGMAAVAAEPEAVQLWEGGPYWATVNLGTSEVQDHSEYGGLYTFDNAANAVTDALGEGWRLPTKEEFDKLVSDEYCTSAWDDTKKGYTFTGKTDGYTGKSIFFPAAGIDYGRGSGREKAGENGYCWSSTEEDSQYAFYLGLLKIVKPYEFSTGRSYGLSVRAVKDPPPPVEYLDWDEVNKTMTNAVCSVYKEYTGQTALDAGMTYVVKSAVTNMTSDVVVGGAAANPTRLILCDGAELFLQGQSAAEKAGLGVASGNVLVIYGQTAGTGKLTAIGGGGAAGIGGSSSSAGGTVTINGGIITATGGTYGAGIGGGMVKNGGMVTINGGVVTATGSNGGAGIGVGYHGGDAGTVAFGAKFGVVAGADAGSATPIAQDDYENNHSAAYVQIGPPTPGSEDNPWEIGEGVTAYTNGTTLVIQGAGAITDLSEIPDAIKDALEAVTIAEATVTGAESDSFEGVGENGMVALTLPDGWQGELPDEDGNWYGATGVTLTAMPLTVKNVTFQQRYPWNGKVDIGFGVTGPEGEKSVVVTVCTNGAKIVDFTAAVAILESGVLTTNLVWDAEAAGLAANFKSDDVTVEVAIQGAPVPQDGQLWAGGPIWEESNIGESENMDHPEYGALYKFDNATNAVAQLTDGRRLPTKDELQALIDNCDSEWDDTKKGYTFTGRGDYAANSIFFPAAGYDFGSGRSRAGEDGYYWSGTTDNMEEGRAYSLNISKNGGVEVIDGDFGYGSSVRAVRDTPSEVAPAAPAISAKSAAGALDLTVGDRIAQDTETLVVDPAWDETDPTSAKVFIDGEEEPRQYTVATNDTWETAALEPGRYELEMQTSCSSYPAGFWKVGDDWVVFDSSNITADVTFEAGKTYLFFGTNTVNGTLTVTDGAKFEYGAGAGFVGGEVDLPNRYEQKTVGGDLYQIIEKIKGCEDNPWDIGEGVTAYTNGTELVIGGEGTITDISEIPGAVMGAVEAITITETTVTGVVSDAFQGIDNVALTLPDGWQGELPKDGNWCGAENVTLTAYPLTVRNVTFAQRYPWNGKVDVTFDLSGAAGETNVVIAIRDGETAVTNFTAAVTIPESGVLATNLVWDATAGLAANFKSDDITVEVAIAEPASGGVQLWANGPFFAECNVGATKPEDYGYYFWWGDTVGYKRNATDDGWVSVVDGTTSIQFSSSDSTAHSTYDKSGDTLKMEGWTDDSDNLVPAHDAATAHLGAPWRMPTHDEFDTLAAYASEWTDDYNGSGVAGYIFKGREEGYQEKSIFLPSAGRGYTTSLQQPSSGNYWSSAPDLNGSTVAYIMDFGQNAASGNSTQSRYYGLTVRPVRDTPPMPSASDIAAKSEAGAVDLRESVPLAEGELMVSNVTWSATAWGAVPDSESTDIVYVNETTGETIALAAGLTDEGVMDIVLPKKDGVYRLEHSTGGLLSSMKFTVSGYPLGSEGNPWKIGTPDPESVIAWKDRAGVVYFQPPRSAVTREGLETITNSLGGAEFSAKIVSEDGSATNDVVTLFGDDGMPYGTLGDALASTATSFTLYEVAGPTITLPAGVAGQTLIVSNLTAGTVITPSSTQPGGAEYVLPFGANVEIYVVATDGYRLLEGTNPIVIDAVTIETTVDTSVLPASKSLAEASQIGDSDTTWQIADGVLRIEGTGDMPDFTADDPAPWNEFADKIDSIRIGEDVEHLGNAAFFASTGATSITLANEEGIVNLAAFVSPDGSATSFPAEVYVVEDGEDTPAVRFEGDADEDYDSLEAAYAAGETDVAPLTLNNLKAGYIEGLEELAGPEPRSEAMQGLLDDAIAAIVAATTPDELDAVAEEHGEKIVAQAEKEGPNKIGESDTTWRVVDGALVIEGTGDMSDFTADNPAPWDKYADEIESVVVGPEVAHLGDASFANCPATVNAEVSFKNPDAAINTDAFVSGDGTKVNTPVVSVETVTEDGRILSVIPGGFFDAASGESYETLQAAIDAGAAEVVSDFGTADDPVVPKTIVEKGVGDDGETYTSIVENKPEAGVAKPVKASRADGLVDIATSEKQDYKLVVVAQNEAAVGSGTVSELTTAMLDALERQEGHQMRCMVTNLVDFSVYRGDLKVDNCEFGSPIAIHVPWTINPETVYGVSRIHNGGVAVISEGAANAVDGEYFTVGDGEIVIVAKNFSAYLIGETLPNLVRVSIPVPEEGYTYVVSNATTGTEIEGELVDGTNVYAVTYGDAVKVYFTPEKGRRLPEGFVNPMEIASVTSDVTVESGDLPQAERYCDGLCGWVYLNGADPADATIVYDFQANLKTTKGKKGKATTQKVRLGKSASGILWFDDPCLAGGAYDGVDGVVTTDTKGQRKLNVRGLTNDQKVSLANDLADYSDLGSGEKSGGKWCAEFSFVIDAACYRVAGSKKIKTSYSFGDCCTEAVAGRFVDVGSPASERLPDLVTTMLYRFGGVTLAKANHVEVMAKIASEDPEWPVKLALAGHGGVAKLKDSRKQMSEGIKSVSGTIVGILPGPDCEYCCNVDEPALVFDCSGMPLDVTDPAENVTAAFGTFTMKFNSKRSVFPTR